MREPPAILAPVRRIPLTRSDASRGPSVRRVAAGAALGLIGVGSLLLVQVWWMSGRTPSWWARAVEVGADAPERAGALERGFASALHQTDRPTPWRVDFSERDANAWLADRLPRWLANQDLEWPGALSTPRVRFERDRVTIGVALLHSGGRVASVSFALRVRDDGAVVLKHARAQIGMASLPALPGRGAVTDLLRSAGHDEDTLEATLLSALRGERALVDDASLLLEDGRRVRLLDLSPQDGRLRLTLTTEQAVAETGR